MQRLFYLRMLLAFCNVDMALPAVVAPFYDTYVVIYYSRNYGVKDCPMSTWTFLTNHAQVLICVANNQRITAREIASSVGITERAVQRILDDLETAGYLSRSREGRQNLYTVHDERPMRHPAQQRYAVRELLELLPPDDTTTSVAEAT